MNNGFFQKLRCRFGNHVLGHFLLQRDQRYLIEACNHCGVVSRITRLNGRQWREFAKMRRTSKVPWQTIDVPFSTVRKKIASQLNGVSTANGSEMSEEQKSDEQATESDGDKATETPPKRKRKPHPVTSAPRQIRTQEPPQLVQR